MIKHVVVWSMNSASTAEQQQNVKSRLEALRDVVSELIEIEVGIDAGNGTMSLISTFGSMDDLAVYQAHSAHQAVGRVIKPLVASRVACDYEY